jgi:hypothetical protein
VGYRSNVALALTSDAAMVLMALCEHEPELRSLVAGADEQIGWDQPPGADEVVKLMWQDIKWYADSDIGIHALEAFMHNTEAVEWYFLRIGEEPDDVQTEGEFWESDMYIQRTIVL